MIDAMINHLFTPKLRKPPSTFKWLAVDDECWCEMLQDQERWRVNQELKRLKDRKILETRQLANKVVYSLTKDGKILMLRKMLAQIEEDLPGNQQCFVIYDIPTNVKEARALVRSLISKSGFKNVQLSVWATKKNVGPLIAEIIKLSGLNKWVKVINGNEL